MDRDGMSSSLLRLFVLSALLFGAALPAAAQTVVGGDRERPSVEVNLDVLNSLGPPPTLPDKLRGQLPLHRPATATAAPQHSPGKTALHRAKRKKPKHKAVAAARHKHQAKTAAVAKPHPMAAASVTPVAAAPRESVTASRAVEHAATPAVTAPTAPTPSAAAPSTPAPAVTPAAAPVVAAPAAEPVAAVPDTAPRPVPTAAATAIPTPAPSPAAVAVMNTPPAIAPAPAPPPAVTPAAAPAALSAARGRVARVLFTAGASELPDSAKSDLKAIAQRLAANEDARLQLMAYAAGGADEANQARRLSLSRALAVRTYLMEQGVRSSRMDVRALGNRLDGSDPPDRVDIVMLDH